MRQARRAEQRPCGSRLRLAVGILLAISSPLAGQVAEEGGQVQVYAHTLTHQSAGEAVSFVFPLLTERGTIELQPGDNTLVIRDTAEALARIVPLILDFDHPARRMMLEIRVIAASAADGSGPGGEKLPQPLMTRLRELLRYEVYRQLANVRLEAGEGEEVRYQLGDEYRVEFRVGTLMEDQRIRLQSFRIFRRGLGGPPMIHTNLNLWLEKPMVLGLAREESSPRALMVVLSCSMVGAPERVEVSEDAAQRAEDG